MWDKMKKLFGKDELKHDIANQVTADILQIHYKAKQNEKKSKVNVQESEDLVTFIENTTAYKLAQATGRNDND